MQIKYVTKKHGGGNVDGAMRIKYYQDGELVAIGTAAELEGISGKTRDTIRAYAMRKKTFRSGAYFEYLPEYYERKAEEEKRKEIVEKRQIVLGRLPNQAMTLHEMAAEAKRRRLSYGDIQAEEYFRNNRKKIKCPKGYTSMRDRETGKAKT